MRITTVRRITQIFFFVLFIWFCIAEHLRAIFLAIAGLAGKLVPPTRSACCPGNHSDDPHSVLGTTLGLSHSRAHCRSGKIFLRMAVPIRRHAPFHRLSRLARTLRKRENRREPIYGRTEDKILRPSGPALPGCRGIRVKHRRFFNLGPAQHCLYLVHSGNCRGSFAKSRPCDQTADHGIHRAGGIMGCSRLFSEARRGLFSLAHDRTSRPNPPCVPLGKFPASPFCRLFFSPDFRSPETL